MSTNAGECIHSAEECPSKAEQPDLVSEPQNAKQRLRNGVIKFLRERECKWKASDVPTLGTTFTQVITNALWTIDGHHEVFANQGFSLPTFAA